MRRGTPPLSPQLRCAIGTGGIPPRHNPGPTSRCGAVGRTQEPPTPPPRGAGRREDGGWNGESKADGGPMGCVGRASSTISRHIRRPSWIGATSYVSPAPPRAVSRVEGLARSGSGSGTQSSVWRVLPIPRGRRRSLSKRRRTRGYALCTRGGSSSNTEGRVQIRLRTSVRAKAWARGRVRLRACVVLNALKKAAHEASPWVRLSSTWDEGSACGGRGSGGVLA